MMRLPPGDYAFDTEAMDGKLWLKLEAGRQYYLKLVVEEYHESWDATTFTVDQYLQRVPAEEGRGGVGLAKPIKPKHVRDRKLVITP